MPTKPIATIEDLIGSRFDARGLQFAHIIGVSFYNDDDLAWLRPLLGVNEETNFAVLPESERGSAILGVAAHLGNQNSAFDRFFYNGGAARNKFLNELRIASELPNPDLPALRTDLLNFLDYVKVLFLYDEVQSAAGVRSGNDPHSLALNVSDPRFSRREDVALYYEGGGSGQGLIRQDLLDDDVVRAHSFYQAIETRRAGGGVVDDAWLVATFPELSRILYPDGAVAWASGDRATYQGIHADILSREAVLSGVIALRGGIERVTDYSDYAAILASIPRDIVTSEIDRALSMRGVEHLATNDNECALAWEVA